MTWKTFAPIGKFVDRVYRRGLALANQARQALETRLERLPPLPQGFVRIVPASPPPIGCLISLVWP
jgi:hypothetical protein